MRAFILASVLAAGCYGTATYGYEYSVPVSNVGYGPDLVYVAPGVQVIADYDEPIFFMDGFYWRFYGSTWYRSSDYTGGWIYAAPPSALLRIEHPHAYIHYRPQGWTPRRHEDRRPPVIRDHRDERPRTEPRREPPPPPPRDHRDRKHDDRRRDHRS